jgi:hypothetical protein
VEREIFAHLQSNNKTHNKHKKELLSTQGTSPAKPKSSGSSFLDEWLAKRQQLKTPQDSSTPLKTIPGSADQSVRSQPSVNMPMPKASPRNTTVSNVYDPSPTVSSQSSVTQSPQAVLPPRGKEIKDSLDDQAAFTLAKPKPLPVIHDRRLHDLQKNGLGENVSFGGHEASSAQSRPEDHRALESALERVAHTVHDDEEQQQQSKQEETILKINKSSDADLTDEIFIDLRGNIHHADETLNTTPSSNSNGG